MILLALAVVCAAPIAAVGIMWQPQWEVKTSFTDHDRAVITQEFGLDPENCEIKKLTFSHAKETEYILTLAAREPREFLEGYIPAPPENGENPEVYTKGDDLTCTPLERGEYQIIMRGYNKRVQRLYK